MPVTLPIEDAYIDGLTPLSEEQTTLTQSTVEEVMQRDFSAVAALGIAVYCERLQVATYADGTKVFYLDWTPEVPGFTLVYIEPWTTSINAEGCISVNVVYYKGQTAAKRAEAKRRADTPL